MFKKKKGIRLSYYKQGFIYFLCANFYRLPAQVQSRIRAVADEVGGVDSDALFDLLVHPDTNTVGISMKYYVSERRLYKLRNAFYEALAKKMLS